MTSPTHNKRHSLKLPKTATHIERQDEKKTIDTRLQLLESLTLPLKPATCPKQQPSIVGAELKFARVVPSGQLGATDKLRIPGIRSKFSCDTVLVADVRRRDDRAKLQRTVRPRKERERERERERESDA
jgi:hypothetical protein